MSEAEGTADRIGMRFFAYGAYMDDDDDDDDIGRKKVAIKVIAKRENQQRKIKIWPFYSFCLLVFIFYHYFGSRLLVHPSHH